MSLTTTHSNKYEKRKANTKRRNEMVREMVNELHEEKRIRYDDVLAKVAAHFGLSPETIHRNILKATA
ncbi:hypothetical protein [Roseivirga sp. UBA1976]|uniref:hypothetical protein n=1 Tax=Roseivirga sp. UBA1976 TaxID=1947386 RepID=UPI00257AA7A4|nr:hypothetical protein [Roseivirga sp. UBA1976]